MNPKYVTIKNGKKPKGSIGWKKELHMREQPEVIDDELIRTREFRNDAKRRHDNLVAMNVPQVLIDAAKEQMDMTYSEFQQSVKVDEENEKSIKTAYAKEHSIEKKIVDEIYDRMEKLPYAYHHVLIRSNFDTELDPISFMGSGHYLHDLYESILKHAHSLYQEKHIKQFNLDYERYLNE